MDTQPRIAASPTREGGRDVRAGVFGPARPPAGPPRHRDQQQWPPQPWRHMPPELAAPVPSWCLRACRELQRQATSLSVRDDSPLCAQLADTLIRMGGAAGTVDTRGLRQALPPGSVGSSSTRQGDVAELWRTMIWGEAQRELEGAGLSRTLPDIFRGTRRTTVTCGKCNRRSLVVDSFSELHLPISSGCLELALRGTREEDRLTGCRRYYCERCHTWADAERTVEIVEAPQILAITLVWNGTVSQAAGCDGCPSGLWGKKPKRKGGPKS